MKPSEILKSFKEDLKKAKDEFVKKSSFYGDGVKLNSVSGLDVIHKSASSDSQIVEFQKRADDCYLVAGILNVPVTSTNIYKSFSGWLKGNAQSELAKAMNTGTAAAGGDWVPTGYSNQLMQMIEVERKLARFFPSFSMPQNPYVWPISTGRPVAKKVTTEGAAVTETTVPSAKLTFDAERLMAYVSVTDDLTEDSIVPMLAEIKSQLALSLVDGEENIILNGCADDSIDSDNSDAEDQRRVAVGLRKLAIANSYTTDLGTFNSDTVGVMRKFLGKFFDPRKCGIVCSVSGYEQLTRLKDSNGNAVCLTVDKAGAKATFQQGQIDEAFGMPVIESGFSRDILNASGIYDNVTKTKTSIQIVRFDAFKIGKRGNVINESQRQVKTLTTDLVASMRMAFMPMFPIASNPVVWNGINITA